MSRGEGEKPGGSAGEEGEGDEAPACRTVPYRIHFLATEPRLSSAHLPGIRFGSSPFWRSGDPSVGRLRSSLDGSGRESPEFPLFAHTQAETNRDVDSQVETKLALTRPSFNAFSEKPCDAMRAASCVMRRACRTPSSSIRTRVRQRVLLPPPPHSGRLLLRLGAAISLLSALISGESRAASPKVSPGVTLRAGSGQRRG